VADVVDVTTAGTAATSEAANGSSRSSSAALALSQPSAAATATQLCPPPFFFGSLPEQPLFLDASPLAASLAFGPSLAPLPLRFTDLFAAVAHALPALEAAVRAARMQPKPDRPRGALAVGDGAGGFGGSASEGFGGSFDDQDGDFSPGAAAEELEDPSARLEPALCLVTGRLLPAGLKLDQAHPRVGALTLHARTLSGGAGLYLLLGRCVVLAVRGAHSATLPGHWSPYLDAYGEPDEGLVRGRPLFLDQERWQGLQRLYAGHRIATEVSRIRASSDRYIKDNYY
jgi:hypothetical protein